MEASPSSSPTALPATSPQDCADVALVDRRVIEFHPPALRMAVETTGIQLYRLPHMPVSSMEMLPEEAAVRFRLGTGDTAMEHVIEGPRLVAMLIGYCMAAGVPLPNGAAKTLRVHEGFVEVRFTIDHLNPPLPTRSVPWRREPATVERGRPHARTGR